MNRIEIETTPNCLFFCPVTGTQLLSPEAFTPSAATVFTHDSETGGVESYAPVFELLWEQVRSEPLDSGRYWSHWERFCEILAEKHPHIGIFSITERGIANGPYRLTVNIGIDFTLKTQPRSRDCGRQPD